MRQEIFESEEEAIEVLRIIYDTDCIHFPYVIKKLKLKSLIKNQ